MTNYVQTVPEMAPEAASAIVALLQRRAGISIPPGKTDLLRNRLVRRLRDLGLDSFEDYHAILRGPNSHAEATLMVEALTTHTTSFFREGRQYEWLAAEGLPDLLNRGVGERQDLTIWSAACSTGAEIYSAAMVVSELARARSQRISFRGITTDISRPILAKAEAAVYTEGEIAGVPEALRRHYLLKSRNNGLTGVDGGRLYRVTSELRVQVKFLQANLIDPDKAPRIAADVVFLRNVLIYFERADQDRIVRSIVARLRPGGYLLTGHAEALPETPPDLTSIKSSIYRKDA